ncbi:MAG: hypothetical protein EBT09_01055 [Actinobacteria bacterium]|nr:hypothetical protein [Actinomycetota bacterium]
MADGLRSIQLIGSSGAGGPGPIGAVRRPRIRRSDMEGAGGLDTSKGLVDEPVLAVAGLA